MFLTENFSLLFVVMGGGESSKIIPESDKPSPVLTGSCELVSVVGTGNYGRALVTKLTSSGVSVVWGSRSPAPGQVTVEEAMTSVSLVILAVPVFSWSQLPLNSLRPGTTVVDCSNREEWCDQTLSNAESLQTMLPPGVFVVKCLNTVSAYQLENQTFSDGKQVSDHHR